MQLLDGPGFGLRNIIANGAGNRFTESQAAKNTITLGHLDTIKVSLTTQEGGQAKRPHQAFLMVKESSGLEAPYPLSVKESGKGIVSIVRSTPKSIPNELHADSCQSQRDLPVQLLLSKEPLQASLVLGSFGSSKGSISPVFNIAVKTDPKAPAPKYEAPLRYGKLDEIHHIFRADPKSPPKIISLVFALAVVATIPALFVGVRLKLHMSSTNQVLTGGSGSFWAPMFHMLERLSVLRRSRTPFSLALFLRLRELSSFTTAAGTSSRPSPWLVSSAPLPC